MSHAEPMSAKESLGPRADELWERAIAAKGGRERLLSIQNVVEIIEYTFWVWFFERRTELHMKFLVLPNKHWGWYDWRPGALGLHAIVFNGEEGICWEINSHYSDSAQRKDCTPLPLSDEYYQLAYLMETRWVGPEPLRAWTDKLEGRRVYGLRVRAAPFEAEYYLDPKTYLVRRAAIYDTRQSSDKPFYTADLFNYVAVDGIQMPTKVSIEGSRKYPRRWEFNVDYDPEAFRRPPSVEAGPYAWKPKSED